MTAARMRWKCTRSTRDSLRSAFGASCVRRRGTGAAIPARRTARSCRGRSAGARAGGGSGRPRPSFPKTARGTSRSVDPARGRRGSTPESAGCRDRDCARTRLEQLRQRFRMRARARPRNSQPSRRDSANIARCLRNPANVNGRSGSGRPASRQACSRISVSDKAVALGDVAHRQRQIVLRARLGRLAPDADPRLDQRPSARSHSGARRRRGCGAGVVGVGP